jgi:sugar porter (SP) family MFS transporter|tara:strand:+ start:59 stop:1621 length:1563 start_codon:yes stop_codon:yes gene_type:complete
MYAAPSRVTRAVTTSARASREPTNARSVTRHRRRAASNAGRSDAGERAREGERDLNGAVLRNFAFPALAGALFGWDIGISSGALENVATSAANGGDGFALSSIESGQFVSASLFGALTASAAAGAGLGDRLGSRKELALAGAAYMVGSVAASVAPGFELLVLGKLIYGLGIGFAMHSAPVYIAETAPSSLRGSLISLKEGFIVGGILLGYLASEDVIASNGAWRQLFLEATPLIGILLAGSLWLPDSPRWIAARGGDDEKTREEARDALVRIRDAKTETELVKIDEELGDIFATATSADAKNAGGMMTLFDGKYLRPLYIGLSVVLFQQFTGQPSVLYYATQTFKAAGWSVEDAANVSVILGVWKLFMTGIAVAKVDSVGRRPLLLGGAGIITACLFALAALNAPGETQTVFQAQASVAAIFLYVGAYQLSFGPIAWLLVGEVFPSKVRSAAVGVATLSNFGSNFLVSLLLPTARETVGSRGTYLGFASVGVFALVSMYFTVIETRGKTLEDIETELTAR